MKNAYLITIGLLVVLVSGHEMPTNETCPHCDLTFLDATQTKRLKETVEEYKSLSIIYALADLASDDIVNQQCFNELQVIQHGINDKQIWAVKAMDSSSKPPSGFVWGNNMWIGSRRGCESLNQPLSITLTSRYPRIMKANLVHAAAEFPVQFLVVHAHHNSPMQIEEKFLKEGVLQLGLCLPQSCHAEEVFNLTQSYFDSRVDNFQRYHEFEAEVIEVKDLKLRDGFFYKKSILVVLLIVLVTACLHYISYIVQGIPRNETITEVSTVEKVLSAFSVEKNFQTIFNSNTDKEIFPVIGGLKTISSILILAFHVQWYKFFTMDNPYIMFSDAEQIRYQMIANAPLLVDMFFVISGFLLIFNYMKNEKQNQLIRSNSVWANTKLFLKLVTKRYIRLTPIYMLIIALTEISVAFIADTSPFYQVERADLHCQKYWWRNLFYIQNLFHLDELCVNWTWSTACEMQYFILFSLLYFIYAKNEKLGRFLYVIAAGTALTVTTYFTFKHDFEPTFDVLWDSGTDLYISPFTRSTPYFVGVAAAWILWQKPQIKQSHAQIIWCLAIVSFVGCCHATIWRSYGIWLSCMVLIYARLLLAVANAWFLISSYLGHGNFLTNFLSSKFFIYFSRTSYSFYLVNPLLVTLIFGLTSSPTHSDTAFGLMATIAVTVVTYVLAIGFSVSFELPYCKLLAASSRRTSSVKANLQAKCD